MIYLASEEAQLISIYSVVRKLLRTEDKVQRAPILLVERHQHKRMTRSLEEPPLKEKMLQEERLRLKKMIHLDANLLDKKKILLAGKPQQTQAPAWTIYLVGKSEQRVRCSSQNSEVLRRQHRKGQVLVPGKAPIWQVC